MVSNSGGYYIVSNSMQVVMPQNYYSKQMVGAQVDQVRCNTNPDEIKLGEKKG